MTQTESQAPKPLRRRYTLWIPLLLAAAILVVTPCIYWPKDSGQNVPPPDNGQAAFQERVVNLARKLIANRQYAEACKLMQTYLSRFPDDTEVRPILAEAMMAQGDNAQAEKVIDQALRVSPRIARVLWIKGELRRLRADTQFMNSFRMAVEESADVTPEYWYKYGRELLAVNNSTEASKWLQKAYDANMRDGMTLSALGEARLGTGKFASAREVLEQAADKLPNDPHTALLLARACRGTGDLKAAAEILETATVAKKQYDPDLYMELGEIMALQKRPIEACDAFREVTHFSRYDRRARAATQAAEIYFANGFKDDALEMINLAVQFRPLDPDIQKLAKKIHAATQPVRKP